MTAVLDLVTDSLTELGYLAAPEVPTAGDGALALRRLNSMIDQWKAERLMIYQVTRSTFSITTASSYTVGSGGDINIARPVYIAGVSFLDTSPDPDQEYPLRSLTTDEWIGLHAKAQTSTQPTDYYYEPTFPTGTLYLFPVPTTTWTGVIYHHQAVPVFSALSDTVTLPPVYERFIVKNLALELAPSFKKQPNPMLVQQAREAREVLKATNLRMDDLSTEIGFSNPNRYWIRQG